jgi:hypothetical protein
MDDLLDRVEDMLGYIELLGRALTPNEIKKVHDLLVDVEHIKAKIKEGLHVCSLCKKSLKYKQYHTPHEQKMCEECYRGHVNECGECKKVQTAILREEREGLVEEIKELDRKLLQYS